MKYTKVGKKHDKTNYTWNEARCKEIYYMLEYIVHCQISRRNAVHQLTVNDY